MLDIFYVKKTVGFLLLNVQRRHSVLVQRTFLYGFCLSWVYISKLGIDQYTFNFTFLCNPYFLCKLLRTNKASNFRGPCILCFSKLRSSRYTFIKTSRSNSLIYLWKLTSIYIFKLAIGHYVLIRVTEAIHISTVTPAFSVLFLLAHIKNNLFFTRF